MKNSEDSQEIYFRDEIDEYTNLLRYSDEWQDLRNLLIKNGFELTEVLLASCVESEDEMEYGVIVLKNLEVFEYSRSTAGDKLSKESFKLTNQTGSKETLRLFPQISTAIMMIREGCLKRVNGVTH
jgi:hypothetical protein